MQKTYSNIEKEEAVGIPLGNRFIKFSPFSMYRHDNTQRRIVLLWLLLCVVIVPSGLLTRIFEWTGILVDVGGYSLYLTLYVPMLFCVPLVMWFGYWWAAIPAYCSTFCVALIGGMPIGWVIIFSLANPIGLAMYAMFYRVTPMRTDLNGLESLVGFLMIALVASLAGSIGAFIWALTNDVGLNVAYPVWLGWWLGGWLQTIFIVAPVLYFLGPTAERYLSTVKNSYLNLNNARRAMVAMIASFFFVLVCFVGAGRSIGLQQLNAIDWLGGKTMSLEQANNIVDSLSYPLFILLAVTIALSYLAYRAVMFWHTVMRGVNEKLSTNNAQLINLVNRDPLSGLYNRRKVFEQLEHDFSRAKRGGDLLSIIMVDADKFKLVNDNYGHLVGDEVIKSIAETTQKCMRQYDTAGRFGGEEFIAILPNASSEQAYNIAQRIRKAVEDEKIRTSEGMLKITISLGIATIEKSDTNGESIVNRADQALLNAKKFGRNRVEVG